MSKTYKGKSLGVGMGGRFARLEDVFERQGVGNPGALAASIGTKKYGQGKMTKWAMLGKKRNK